jgi:peptidoglycan/LPS O-acetylase OafA/YrhL
VVLQRERPAARPDARLTSPGHRDDIQGLRAVAVLLVALGHAGIRFLRGGFVGVDVFFVLSGFLITGLLIAGAEKRGFVSLREFYARRAKRILPAAALTLIITDIAAYHLLNFVRAKQAIQDSIWAAFFSANVQFARQGVDYFARSQPPSPIQHYWSLAVEEQFYLVWPVLLSVVLVGIAVHRRRRPSEHAPGLPAERRTFFERRLALVIILASLGSLAWSISYTHRTPAAAYFSTLARAWELGLGAALAIGASRFAHLSDRARAVMGWAGVAAIGLAAVLFTDTTPFPGSWALLPTVGTALVIAAGIGSERSSRGVGTQLARAPLRYVGDRSYAFYLWHWPVLLIAASYAGHSLSVGQNLLVLGGAFTLSIVSYALVENPIRRAPLRRPVRTSAVLWGTTVALVVLVAVLDLRSIDGKIPLSPATPVGAIPTLSPPVEASPGAPRALPAVIAAVQAARQGSSIPGSLEPSIDQLLSDRYHPPSPDCVADHDEPKIKQVCPLLEAGSSRTLVVFGDSHAAEWMPAILWAASQDGWRVIPLIELGCIPSRYASVCMAFVEWAEREVASLHPDAVLVGARLAAGTPKQRADSVSSLGALAAAMRPLAPDVVVIGDPPAQAGQPTDCLLTRGATLQTCMSTLSDDQLSVYRDVAGAVTAAGAGFIDTIGWFCFENQCPMIVGHTIAYRDNQHISTTYALELRQLFRDAFKQALTA